MKNRQKSTPSYRLHKQSGQAVVTLSDGFGNRRDVLLGPHDSPESYTEYARVVNEWKASGHALPARGGTQAPADLTVAELLLRYWRHAEGYYRKGGEPTEQLDRIKRGLRIVGELYGPTPAAAFGPRSLKAVRDRMLRHPCGRCKGSGVRTRKSRRKGEAPTTSTCGHCGGKGECGWARRLINQSVGCVKRAFKWAASEELVPPSVFHGLQSVDGLRRGRTEAREPPPVRPVEDALVDAVLPFLTPPVRAMVQVQRLTGMRPGEVVLMRPCDVDRSGAVWAYRPGRHKTEHHARRRTVFVGPRAQAVLLPFLEGRPADAYCFSPAEGMAAFRAVQRENRKTPVQPSQADRSGRRRRKEPGGRYTPNSYRQSVERACRRAGVVPWHPHQLRHSAATVVRAEADLDTARTVLGQTSLAVAEVYAAADLEKAREVIRKIG